MQGAFGFESCFVGRGTLCRRRREFALRCGLVRPPRLALAAQGGRFVVQGIAPCPRSRLQGRYLKLKSLEVAVDLAGKLGARLGSRDESQHGIRLLRSRVDRRVAVVDLARRAHRAENPLLFGVVQQELLQLVRQVLVVLGLSQGPVKGLHVRRSVGRHLVRDIARGAVVNGHFAGLGRRRLRGLRVAKAGEEEEEKKSGRRTTSPGSRHCVTNAFRAP